MNGVSFYGPEDGPGGDAVATHIGQYTETEQDGANLQVHGTITNLKINDCIMVDGNYSLRVDISSIIRPDTFAEDKGATFTGILRVVDGEMYLEAVKVQMGCPSKYQPAEE